MNWPGRDHRAVPDQRLELERPGVDGVLLASRHAERRRASLRRARASWPQRRSTVAVEIEQAKACPLEALDHHLREAAHQLVAERGVALAFTAQAGAVEAGGAHGRRAPGRRSASGTARRATTSRAPRRPRSSRSHRAARRDERLERDAAVADDVEACRPGRPRGRGARRRRSGRSRRSRRSARAGRPSRPANRGTAAMRLSSCLHRRPPSGRADRGRALR